MSRRKLLLRQKIRQAQRAGKDVAAVLPSGCKRKSLMRLLREATKAT